MQRHWQTSRKTTRQHQRRQARQVAGGKGDEVLQILETLNSCYDDLKSGRVKPIDGEEAFARLMGKTEAERNLA